MAKLFFNQSIQDGHLVGAAKTQQDIEYLIGDRESGYVVHSITDTEFDNLINGTTSIVYENNTVVLRDEVKNRNEETVTLSALANSLPADKSRLTSFKERCEEVKRKKPNHSQITKINDALTYLNTLDEDNLTESIIKSLLDNNKYIAIDIL